MSESEKVTVTVDFLSPDQMVVNGPGINPSFVADRNRKGMSKITLLRGYSFGIDTNGRGLYDLPILFVGFTCPGSTFCGDDIPGRIRGKALPCPFCGRDALLRVERFKDNNDFMAVKCNSCGCVGPGMLAETEEEAIKIWNETRVPPWTGVAEAGDEPPF